MNKFLDSFDHYVTAEIAQKWTSTTGAASISAANGRRASQCLRLNGVAATAYKVLDVSDVGMTIGLAAKFAGFDNTQFIRVFDIGVVQHLTFQVTAGGLITVRRGTTAGTLLGTSSTGISAGVYNYLEFKFVIDDAVGSVEVRINGTTVLNLINQDTRNAGVASCNSFDLCGNVLGNIDIDDLYVNNSISVGGLPGDTNTGLWGDVRIDCHYATGNGGVVQGTPSSGVDQFAMVDELLTDGDTTYNTLPAAILDDTFITEDLKVSGATIKSVQTVINARKNDAGVATISPSVWQYGVPYPPPYSAGGQALTTSYMMYMTIWADSPSGSNWNATLFNESKFGYKRNT